MTSFCPRACTRVDKYLLNVSSHYSRTCLHLQINIYYLLNNLISTVNCESTEPTTPPPNITISWVIVHSVCWDFSDAMKKVKDVSISST